MSTPPKSLSKFKVGQEVNIVVGEKRWRGRIVAYRGRIYNGRDFFEVTFGERDEDGHLVVHGYSAERLEALATSPVRHNLDQMLASITPDNTHRAVDEGEAVGREEG